VGDTKSGSIRLTFNPQLRVEFRGATVTSDAGLLLPRELDDQLGLDALVEHHLSDPRTGHNRQFPLRDLFRQSIYSRLAGYEDTNDAERLAEDPTFRMLASRERRETSVALTSTLHWFETDVLTEERNYRGLARLNTALIQHAAARSANQRVTLDIDSSESPVHGAQEQSAYNGHFESVCYHPLFVFNPEGDPGLTCMVVCFDQFSRKGALMNTRWAVGLCAIALVTIPVFPNSSAAQGTSLKDQLVGTWIYVSSTAKRDDGSNVPRPSLQGAVTYTGDGRFHFIVTRTDAPKYASGDLARPSPDEAMAIASGGSIAYTGTYTVDENSKTIHVSIETSTFPNLVGAPNQRRIITSITADEMKFTNPRTLAGLTLEIVWKRAK
jgi:Transposase DDE domain group 1/Lipocalin-like domain